jgi:hypothetical protein
MGSSPSSPPPPPPSCPQSGTVMDGGVAQSTFISGAQIGGTKMWYSQAYTHSSNGSHTCGYPAEYGKMNALKNDDTVNNSAYEEMIQRVCINPVNLTKSIPGDKICAEHAGAVDIAKAYCGEGENIINETDVCNADTLPGGLATYKTLLNAYCTANPSKVAEAGHACANLNTDPQTKNTSLFESLAAQHCAANPGEAWCSCYNIMNDVCASNSSASGCAKKRQKFDKLVAGTPSGQKNLWSGLEKCFGGVCTGTNKFLPPGHDLRCNSSVNVCVQEVNVESLNDSDMTLTCDIDSGGEPSVGTGGGGGGGGGGGDTEQETITIPRSVGEVRSFLPTNISDLRTSKKKQVGVATVGGSFMSVICVILLIVATTMGAGPIARARRFR